MLQYDPYNRKHPIFHCIYIFKGVRKKSLICGILYQWVNAYGYGAAL